MQLPASTTLIAGITPTASLTSAFVSAVPTPIQHGLMAETATEVVCINDSLFESFLHIGSYSSVCDPNEPSPVFNCAWNSDNLFCAGAQLTGIPCSVTSSTLVLFAEIANHAECLCSGSYCRCINFCDHAAT